jgi:hypothetical protein
MKREYQINALDELTVFGGSGLPGIWTVVFVERGAPEPMCRYFCKHSFIGGWCWFGDTDVKSVNGISLR